MLRAALAFFVLAIIAMVLGASGIAGVSMEVGRTLLIVFLVLAVISFLANMVTGRKSNLMSIALLATAFAALNGCSSAEKRVDQALSTPSAKTETASREAGAVAVTEVNFDKGSFVLSEGSRLALKDLISKARANNKIDEIKVLAWADTAYPANDEVKVPQAQVNLADKRATAIADYIRAEMSLNDVEKYNMTKRPGQLAGLFNTDDARTKEAFENAGVTSADGKAITGKASRAVIMVMPE